MKKICNIIFILLLYLSGGVKTAAEPGDIPPANPEELESARMAIRSGLSDRNADENAIRKAIDFIKSNSVLEYDSCIVEILRCRYIRVEYIRRIALEAACHYASPTVYAALIRMASGYEMNPLDASYVYNAILYNREFIDRQDILGVLASPAIGREGLPYSGGRMPCSSDYNGFLRTVLFAIVAMEYEMPELAEMCAEYVTYRDSRSEPLFSVLKETLIKYPDVSKPSLRRFLLKGALPCESGPWTYEVSIGSTPSAAVVFCGWLADMKDEEAIVLLEYYATCLNAASSDSGYIITGFIGKIGGAEAVMALRRLNNINSSGEGAKLGDPVAIDDLLKEERRDQGYLAHGCFCGDYNFDFALSVIKDKTCEDTYNLDEGEFPPLDEKVGIIKLWRAKRPFFVREFIKTYGFDPDVRE